MLTAPALQEVLVSGEAAKLRRTAYTSYVRPSEPGFELCEPNRIELGSKVTDDGVDQVIEMSKIKQ